MNRSFLIAASFALMAGSAAQAGALEATDAFARATPPGAQVGGVFLRLTNHGEATALIDGRTDIARDVQIHSHDMDEAGVMRMRQVAGGLPLPMHQTVTLQPGGYHIMLVGLTGRLVEGEDISLTLEFADGRSLPMTVPVRGIAAAMPGAEGHDMHEGMDHGHTHSHGHTHGN